MQGRQDLGCDLGSAGYIWFFPGSTLNEAHSAFPLSSSTSCIPPVFTDNLFFRFHFVLKPVYFACVDVLLACVSVLRVHTVPAEDKGWS